MKIPITALQDMIAALQVAVDEAARVNPDMVLDEFSIYHVFIHVIQYHPEKSIVDYMAREIIRYMMDDSL